MSIYTIATVILAGLAAFWLWRKPRSLFPYVLFFLSFMPITYKQLVLQGQLRIALTTLLLPIVIITLRLVRRISPRQ